MLELNRIYCGDCLELMKEIPDKSVDLVLTDLPYGQTANEWDSKISIEALWQEWKRVRTDNAPTILFGQGMFSAELMLSNKREWRYNLIWKKGNRATGFLNARKMPLRSHEDILVFYKELPVYNPQFTVGKPSHSRGDTSKPRVCNTYHKHQDVECDCSTTKKYPKSILNFEKPHPPIHPTEKPIPLCEYLIRTYSNEGSMVLDNCCGAGSVPVAARNCSRQFIGIDICQQYCDMAQRRLDRVNNHRLTDFGEPVSA